MSKVVENEEISLKELIILIQSYGRELIRKWWIIIIMGPLFGILMLLYEMNKETTYSSHLTFMMDSDSGASLGGISSLLGGFGIAGGDNNIDKMIRLIKSRSIIRESLFKKITIDGKEDFFANHIMRTQELEVFADEEETIRFFFTTDKFDKYAVVENLALKTLYKFVVGSEDGPGILAITKDDLSGIITINVVVLNEIIAVEYPSELFKIVEDYYISKVIEKNANTYEIIEVKHDSIVSVIASKEYRLAQEYDKSKNLILRTSQLDRARLEKDLRILYEQLAEVLKNKELAEFSLLSVTPVIQSIDQPIFPLKPDEPSKIKGLAIGGILGGFLAGLLIIALKLYRDTMNEDEDFDYA